MAKPMTPTPRPTFACPVCGGASNNVTFNGGWMVRGLLGTRTGTYPDPIPNEPGRGGASAPAEPFPPLDEFIVSPCGDRIDREQASALRATEAPA